MMDWKQFGRKRSRPNRGTSPAFTYSECGKPRQASYDTDGDWNRATRFATTAPVLLRKSQMKISHDMLHFDGYKMTLVNV